MTKLRVVLADDHAMMREGVRMIVNAQPTMEVVGEAADGAAAVALSNELRPDVIVMDLSMPEVSGLSALEALRRSRSGVKVLVLTRHADRAFVQQSLDAGAKGYVLKRSPSDELVRAICRVAAGQTYLDPAITDQVVGRTATRRRSSGARGGASLSGREEQILRLVAIGLLSKEVAAYLRISAKTVDTHKANAMKKLGMRSRVDVVRYAVLCGWLQET
jgi:DNA-binding NarL/FixJ family response regulator